MAIERSHLHILVHRGAGGVAWPRLRSRTHCLRRGGWRSSLGPRRGRPGGQAAGRAGTVLGGGAAGELQLPEERAAALGARGKLLHGARLPGVGRRIGPLRPLLVDILGRQPQAISRRAVHHELGHGQSLGPLTGERLDHVPGKEPVEASGLLAALLDAVLLAGLPGASNALADAEEGGRLGHRRILPLRAVVAVQPDMEGVAAEGLARKPSPEVPVGVARQGLQRQAVAGQVLIG